MRTSAGAYEKYDHRTYGTERTLVTQLEHVHLASMLVRPFRTKFSRHLEKQSVSVVMPKAESSTRRRSLVQCDQVRLVDQ